MLLVALKATMHLLLLLLLLGCRVGCQQQQQQQGMFVGCCSAVEAVCLCCMQVLLPMLVRWGKVPSCHLADLLLLLLLLLVLLVLLQLLLQVAAC
jgi:hypothetical protein